MEVPDSESGLARHIVESALKELIDTRHLYQTLTIDFRKAVVRSAVEAWARRHNFNRGGKKKETIEDTERELCAEMAQKEWSFESAAGDSRTITVGMPPVSTLCGNWGDVEAFNLRAGAASIHAFSGKFLGDQVFCFELECQRCRKCVIVFEVKKNADKIEIVGRSEFEEVAVPAFIPKNVRRFYSEAVIAVHCKAVLAGIFLLRTLIEQHMGAVTAKSKKMRGDELCDAYAASLPDGFKKTFPSLKEIYGRLSDAMHEAKADHELFESQRKEVERHFDALRVFRLHQS